MRKLGTSGPEPSSEAVGTYSSAPHQTLRNRSSFRFTDNVSCSCSRRLGGIPRKSPALRVLLPHVRHGLGLGVPGLGLGAPDICHGVSPRNSSFSFMVLKRTVLPQAVNLFRVFPGVHIPGLWLTLGTLYSSGVGINKTKQHTHGQDSRN